MKRTLHILALSRRAGVELMFINYLKCMKEKNPECLEKQFIFAISISPYYEKELSKLGIKYYVANFARKYDVKVIFNIKRIIKEYDIELVYGQNIEGNLWGALATFGARRIELVCHEHGTAWTNNIIPSIATYLWAYKANKIICNSYAAKTILNKRFKVKEKKMSVVYNGIPINSINKTNKIDNYIIFVGRLDHVKSPETIIEALPFIIKEIPTIKLDILGEGKLYNKLIKMVSSLGLQNFVTFSGSVSNVDEYMAKASLLVVPSIREALGNVIIEAALQKTPTIGTNVDGIAEVIVHNKTGLLLNPEIDDTDSDAPKLVVDPNTNRLINPKKLSPEFLAKTIIELLEENCVVQMGESAFHHVKKRFSLDKYYNNINKKLDC